MPRAFICCVYTRHLSYNKFDESCLVFIILLYPSTPAFALEALARIGPI